jgi:small nuclear ribonucleoprotein (snRNP)-like protein
MLVELKNGETLNGHLVTCDTWMNLTLKEVVQTSPVYYPFVPPVWTGEKDHRVGGAGNE